MVSFFHRVAARKHFGELDAAGTVRQILLAVNYLHCHAIVHRNLKLESFLYENDKSDHLKLVEFGLCRLWEPTDGNMTSSVGTLGYMAPEVLNESYTLQCDMWSVGVIAYILLLGRMPFTGSDKVMIERTLTGSYKVKKEAWERISTHARDFIQQLLVLDVGKRLTAKEALQHVWIVKREEKTMLPVDLAGALTSFRKASTLRRACMSLMAWSMSSDDQAKVRDAFIAINTDGSGTVTIDEFKSVLEEHMSKAEVVDIFKALDATNTNSITYSDFLAAMACSRAVQQKELLQETFNRFDSDGSGSISVAEMEDILGKIYDGKKTAKMIYDAGVVQGGEISFENFVKLVVGEDG